MPALRVVLVCVQCLAIASCGWAMGLTMERYAHRPRSLAKNGLPVLAAAIIVNTAVLALLSITPP